MEIEQTQCCAVDEICHLSYSNNAKDAMKDFCDYLCGYEEEENEKLDPAAFYTFTGVVKFKGTECARNRGYYNYGKAFKAFILRNKLGMVTESQARPNRINHPNHVVKVWVWSPNATALNKWWRKNREA